MSGTPPATVLARLHALRARMEALGLDAYIVPSSDEHQNEYLGAHKRRREALSGFSGSAGELLVVAGRAVESTAPPVLAHLFVDSRYHLQADEEVPGPEVQVHKLGREGVSPPPRWLARLAGFTGGLRVGCDPMLLTPRMAAEYRAALEPGGSEWVALPENLADAVWQAHPPLPPQAPRSTVTALAEQYSGEGLAAKLARVRDAMEEARAAHLVLSGLDEIAWLTNLRGGDIPHNPVFEAWMTVSATEARLFTDNPLDGSAKAALKGTVEVSPDGAFLGALEALAGEGGAIWLDPAATSEGILLALGDAPLVQKGPNPVIALKARKNPVEIQVSRDVHIRAACAKVRSFSLLESRLAEGEAVSEEGYARMLAEEYAREEGFTDLSFTTIAGFAETGAIVHYATPSPERMLTPGGMLLVDSGAQMLGATTDDTRTIIIGEPTPLQRQRFTLVLRGHVRLAMQVFPEGTTGVMLDALARAPLWSAGLDYGHGTGHGVGAYLNVHEGPHSISPRGGVALEPGMVVSNEPGFYEAGWGGIRCENLYVVEEATGLPAHPGGKGWLRLSPLTLIPFDRRLIDTALLAEEERVWLNAYHAAVREALAPRLEEPHRAWLHAACEEL